MEELVCKSCGLIQKPCEAKLSLTTMKNQTEHIRADCGSCGKWIKWLKKTPEYMELIEGIVDKQVLDLDTPTPILNSSGRKDNECPFDID